MKILTLPDLRLGQLQTVGETSIDICKDITEIAPELLIVNSSFDAFIQGMLRDKASAEKKRILDQSRDHKVSGFMNVVFEEKKFPNEDASVINAHSELLKIVNKYGLKIIRLPRDEETAAIDNLLADIAQMDVTPLAATGILRWIPTIKTANIEYKKEAKAYISESSDTASTKSASDLAPALEDALEDLYLMLFATIKRTPTDVLKKAYADLETLINSMK